MGKLTTRPYEPADAAAVADLINLMEVHAGGHPGWTADDVRESIGAEVPDPGADSRMVVAPGGTLAGYAMVPTPPENGFRVDLYGGVHPAYRGRGIGRELLDWQRSRAAELHRAIAPDAAWEVHAGALVTDDTALRLYRRAGLRPVRYWFDMTAPTSAPALMLPDGLRAVRCGTDREAALYAAHIEAFADHWGYQRRGFTEWTTMTVRSAGFLPDLSAVALDGDEIAGYVLSYKDADRSRVYIGQVGVRRPWRRRGVAAALLSRVLRSAASAGYQTASLGVDADSPTGAVGVYERVGFTVAYRAVSYSAPIGRPAPVTG